MRDSDRNKNTIIKSEEGRRWRNRRNETKQ